MVLPLVEVNFSVMDNQFRVVRFLPEFFSRIEVID